MKKSMTEKEQKSTHASMVSNLYYRLLPQQMSSGLVLMLNSIIDSLFTSRYMGAEGMAAVGFYSPFSNIIYLCFVLITGTQILCCNSIGRGNEKETVSLFSTCAVILTVYAAICSALMLFFSVPLANLLGASGHVAVLLAEYIRSVSFGMIALVLYSLFMTFLDLNSRIDLSWASIISMLISNVILNQVFIKYFNMGIGGLGLATSLSSMIAMLIALTGVIQFKRKLAVYLQVKHFCFDRVFEMGKLGSTALVFNLSAGFKSYVMNILLMNIGGTNAVAAAAVMNSVCCFVGMIPSGTASAARTLGSIFYGEKNRPAMEELLNVSLRTAAIMSIAAIAVIQIFAPQFVSVFYPSGSQVYT
ncbi:MAG: hypothetical protein EOM64_04940, partial [Erysipelotrichia bacterium]|nr:hypothetical protein [Erysipelotrichia bacterium]